MNYINSCFRWTINELMPFYQDGLLPQELSDKIKIFYSSISSAIDWYNPTKEELLQLGFINWEDHTTNDDTSGVWFIPRWLFPIIPEGIVLCSKNGSKFEFHSRTASKEVMFGCLTYGLLITGEHND